MKDTVSSMSRRNFLRHTAAVTAAFAVVPRHVLAGAGEAAPSRKLNLGAIGVGGVGENNIAACKDENIVALCDVDPNNALGTYMQYPKAKQYKDFRVMLEKRKDLDAVLIATPDHTHAVIALAAMRCGKHVFVQKPLTHSVKEARVLTEAARRHKVVTQMGNQGHSGDGIRSICEWIWSGAIGPVREVHAWTNRPVWPQGVEIARPKETPPLPKGMDWDLWIGPAPYRPYHPAYHPEKWRAWWDFGTGSLGDLGCHILDPVFWALKLKYPVSVEGCITAYWEDFWKKTEPKNEMYPRSSIVRYRFPAREDMPEVRVTWWDGGLTPPRPDELEPGRKMGDENGGVIFIGDKGKLMCGCYARNPQLIPDKAMKEFTPPVQTLERVPGGQEGHEKDWLRACKGGRPASSHFDCAGPLSEMVLMGNLAIRFPDRLLLWNGEKMEITNDTDANAYVARTYRNGWTL